MTTNSPIEKLEEAKREMELQFDCASFPYWEGRAEAFQEAIEIINSTNPVSGNEQLDVCNKALLRVAGVENPEPRYEEPENEQPDGSFDEWWKNRNWKITHDTDIYAAEQGWKAAIATMRVFSS